MKFNFTLEVEHGIIKNMEIGVNIYLDVLKTWGKQWQTTPKNLPRMQRTRAIPVA